MKYTFAFPKLVLEARSIEEALQHVGNHIAVVARHHSEGHTLEECEALFSVDKADDKADAVDLRHDAIVKEKGPIPLKLDPESPQGIDHAAQLVDREQKRKAAAPPLKDSRTDAENLALHSADEQAKLNKKEA